MASCGLRPSSGQLGGRGRSRPAAPRCRTPPQVPSRAPPRCGWRGRPDIECRDAMHQDDITIVICDSELTSRYVIEDWQSLDATVTRNAPGPGSVRCAVTRELMAALEPGAHVALDLGDPHVAWHAGALD